MWYFPIWETPTWWRGASWKAEDPEPSPVRERIEEVAAEIEDLDRRRQRQVLALEAPETNQSMFALVAKRIPELEDAIADRRARLEHLERQLPPEPPRLEDVALVLERLPVLGQRLAELPRAELPAPSRACSSRSHTSRTPVMPPSRSR